jgi:opacity protein-like surface antigen
VSSKFFQVSALCFSALILAGVRPAFAQVEDGKTEDGWQFAASVYLWGASISGETRSGTGISVELEDLLSHLEMVFMGSFEARKGKWSLLSDVIYLDLSGDKSVTVDIPIGPGIPVTTDASVDLTSWILHLAGGYNLLTNGKSRLDLIAGARYLDLDADVFLSLQSLGPGQSVNFSVSDSLWDGIVGVKGRFALSERWFLPYYFDIGAGDSDFTWQASAGVSFQAAKWADIGLVYRYLDWEFESDSLINDFNVSGPALGAVFRF